MTELVADSLRTIARLFDPADNTPWFPSTSVEQVLDIQFRLLFLLKSRGDEKAVHWGCRKVEHGGRSLVQVRLVYKMSAHSNDASKMHINPSGIAPPGTLYQRNRLLKHPYAPDRHQIPIHRESTTGHQ